MIDENNDNDAKRHAECVARFRRAQMANRLFHSCTGKAQLGACRVKGDLLLSVVKDFPDLVEINPDPGRPGYVSVFLANIGGLHLPIHLLGHTPSGYRAA